MDMANCYEIVKPVYKFAAFYGKILTMLKKYDFLLSVSPIYKFEKRFIIKFVRISSERRVFNVFGEISGDNAS